MSGLVSGQVWNLELPQTEKFVLLAMADHADHTGRNVFPSVGLIAWKTGYSERHVRRTIGKLKDAGLLKVQEAKPGCTVRYRIDISAGVQNEPYRVDNSDEFVTPDIGVTPDKVESPPPLTSVSPTPDKAESPINVNNHHNNRHDMTALIFQAFSEVGELTALIADDLSDLINEHGEIEVLEAVKCAAKEKPSKPMTWIAAVLGENTNSANESAPLVKAYCEAVNMIGQYEPKGKERAAFREMEDAGITPEQVKQFIASKSQEEYWQGKRISPVVCARDIGAFIQFKLVKFEKPTDPKDRPGWQFTFEN